MEITRILSSSFPMQTVAKTTRNKNLQESISKILFMVLLLLFVQSSHETDTENKLTSTNTELEKRASIPAGFLQMRGRKPNYEQDGELTASFNNYVPFEGSNDMVDAKQQRQDAVDESDLLGLIEKRGISPFMPTRGRKSSGPITIPSSYDYYYSGNSGRLLTPNRNIGWHFALPSQQQPIFYNPIDNRLVGGYIPELLQSASASNPSSSMYAEQQQQKRGKGIAFFGSRGKRSLKYFVSP